MGDTEFTTPDKLREVIRRYGNNMELARKSGVSRNTILVFLRGGGLRLETFLALCKALGLSPPRLIEVTVEKDHGTRTPSMFFSEVPSQQIPDKLRVTEDDARVLLEIKNTSDPYNCVKLALMILESGKVTLPEKDLAARRAVTAAIGILSAYQG